VTQGVVLYLLEPFSFAMFRSELEHYAAYRRQLEGIDDDVVQDEVDRVFGALRSRAGAAQLPKGLGPETLRQITDVLRAAPRWPTAGGADQPRTRPG
jgi:response regulator of citrate/malate metabolism